MRILFFFFLLISQITFGQNTIQGKVKDSETGVPLSNVVITNATNKVQVITNDQGEFIVDVFGVYVFKKQGYISKKIDINSARYRIVQLSMKPSELDEVVVQANQIPRSLKSAISSIEIITSKDIERGNDINISEVLNRAPGVFVQSGALNTNRFTIRGIGSRNLFGTSKIRAYFKDIPLTNGSGETSIEDFELAAISRVDIIKGATASIYGAGLGGTIHLTAQNSYINETSLNSQVAFGSFGLQKQVVNFNHGSANNSIRGVYSNTHSDGYRDNNEYDRQTFTISSNHLLNENNDLTVLLSYVDLKAFIPSSINANAFENDPSSAAFTWGRAQGFEDTKRGILGVTWDHQYSSSLKQVTSVFGSFRDSYEPRPFNILEEDVFAFGLRSRFLGTTKLFERSLKFTVGGEYFKDRYVSKTFENLYRDFDPSIGSVQGLILSNFKENRSYYNLFFEADYQLSEKTKIVVGLNYNETSYDLNDRFPTSIQNPDQSGSFDYQGIFSPQIGIAHSISQNITAYSNVGHGFSPLSLEETLLPDGQINNDLQPETGWTYELGFRGNIFKERLQFTTALYRMDIKNLLVSRRIANDQFIGINAGRTQHDGIEITANYQWVQKESVQLSTFFNYSRNDFIFKEFIDGDNYFSGNQLTGVPSEILNAGIDLNSKMGFYGNLNFQYVGKQPITDGNTLFSDSYSLLNLKMGFQTELFSNFRTNLFFGINNLTDKKYASQILINASSFGGNAPRYFYPGNPVNYFGGLSINYIF